MGYIYAPVTEFRMDFGGTDVIECIYDTLLRYYQAVELLMAKGGS